MEKKKAKQKTERYELFWNEEVRNKDMWDRQTKGKIIYSLICILLYFEFEEFKNCCLDVYIVPALLNGFIALTYIINVLCKKI